MSRFVWYLLARFCLATDNTIYIDFGPRSRSVLSGSFVFVLPLTIQIMQILVPNPNQYSLVRSFCLATDHTNYTDFGPKSKSLLSGSKERVYITA